MTEIIRPACPGDAERIVDIWASGWRDGHLADAPPELLAHRSREAFVPRVAAAIDRTHVAEVDGTIAGFTMVHGDEVDQLYVDAAFRGTGVASRLLADAAIRVRAAGHPVPWLAVARGNARARHFYAREGWTDAGEFAYPAEIGGGTSLPVPCRRMELRDAPTLER
ncbi:MAG: GNAT family N-acetyltransferase [Protaetiibacter sp.]